MMAVTRVMMQREALILSGMLEQAFLDAFEFDTRGYRHQRFRRKLARRWNGRKAKRNRR